MNLTVVGFGEVGATITSLLINQTVEVCINVMDPEESISGKLLDMQHAATFKRTQLTLNDNFLFEKADFVFYCAGIRNEKGSDRTSVVGENKALINSVFKDINLSEGAIIIVVTNPVELISSWISELFSDEVVVLGTATFLDTVRFQFIISRALNYPLGKVETPVWGEHGRNMVPILSNTKVDGKPITSILSQLRLNDLIEEIKNAANSIRLTEEATKFGVAQCALELMIYLQSDQPILSIAAIKLSENVKEMLNISAPIFFSLPCQFSKHGLEPIEKLNINESEWNGLRVAASEIEQVYNKFKKNSR